MGIEHYDDDEDDLLLQSDSVLLTHKTDGSSPPGLYPSIRVRTAPPVSVMARVRVSVSLVLV